MFLFRSAVLALILGSSAACAQTNPYADHLHARLLPGWRNADGSHVAGLELTLAEGWKTYWRSPGEGGIPPQFDWSGSRNLSDLRVVWPRPVVFDQNGLQSIGYKHRVILPLVVDPGRSGKDVELQARIDLGICETVCVPLQIQVQATLPADQRARSPQIVSAMAQRPYTGAEAGVTATRCSIAPGRDGSVTVEARVSVPPQGRGETAVVEMADPAIWVTPTKTARQGGDLVAQVEMTHAGGGVFAFDRSAVTVTILTAERAIEISGCDRS